MGFKRRPPRRAVTDPGEFMLYVSYSLDIHTWGAVDQRIDTAVGIPHSSSGTHDSHRDLDYRFDTAAEMISAAKRVASIRLRGVEYSHDELCGTCNGLMILFSTHCPTCYGTGKI
jgi:hypothetical protein